MITLPKWRNPMRIIVLILIALFLFGCPKGKVKVEDGTTVIVDTTEEDPVIIINNTQEPMIPNGE
jgi:hypothetical protein